MTSFCRILLTIASVNTLLFVFALFVSYKETEGIFSKEEKNNEEFNLWSILVTLPVYVYMLLGTTGLIYVIWRV